jgi:hypothetical protein
MTRVATGLQKAMPTATRLHGNPRYDRIMLVPIGFLRGLLGTLLSGLVQHLQEN